MGHEDQGVEGWKRHFCRGGEAGRSGVGRIEAGLRSGALLVVALVLPLACGGGAEDGAEPDASAAPVAEERTAAPAEPAPADVAAPPADATTTESGLSYRMLTSGTGAQHPGPYDRVAVHYTGWTTNGRMFDSSRGRNREATFALNQVVAGWTEGLQLMVVGDKTRFWIPEKLAYQGRPGRPAGMLVFDVELLKVTEAPADTPKPKPVSAPDDVARPPEDALRTDSGLAHKLLAEGTGDVHPRATDRVEVHYSGWTTKGRNFDSSVARGKPATFPLNRVIAGWTEGLQLMVVGEKRRFWVPEHLAYKGKAGRPSGMLVFDVELLGIEAE